jgi:ketosteroid isomerase-like protein
MNMHIRAIGGIGAAALVLAGASAGLVQAAARADGPVAVVNRFHEALQKGDAVTAADLLADDALIFEQGSAENSKAEYQQSHLPGDIAYSAATHDEVVSRRSDVAGATAIVMSQGRTTGAFEGKTVNRLTTETMVVKRVGGRWRISHIHWSSRAGG